MPATARSDAVVIDGFPLGVYGVGVVNGMVAAGAYTEFREDGTGRVRGLVGNSTATLRLHDSGFTFVIDGDQIELTATTGDCEVGASGMYPWSGDASELRLAFPQDSCGDRRLALHGDWYPLGDTPIVEIDPGGDSVTIDSPIGPIDWQVVAGQAYAWVRPDPQKGGFLSPYRPVVAINGGFVAVVDEQANMATDRRPTPRGRPSLGRLAKWDRLAVDPIAAIDRWLDRRTRRHAVCGARNNT